MKTILRLIFGVNSVKWKIYQNESGRFIVRKSGFWLFGDRWLMKHTRRPKFRLEDKSRSTIFNSLESARLAIKDYEDFQELRRKVNTFKKVEEL